MRHCHQTLGTKKGFTLLEVMVGIGVMSIAGMALMGIINTGMKANKSNDLRADLQDIKRTIADRLSCSDTLGAAPTSCSASTVFTLKDKSGHEINPGNKIGSWTIKAKCEDIGGTKGLSVYATKRVGGLTSGPFVIDPIRNLPFDESHPKSRLFDPSSRPCAVWFGGAAAAGTCPANSYVKSVNFDNKSMVCEPLPTCAWNEFRMGNTCQRVGMQVRGGYERLECTSGTQPVTRRNGWGAGASGACEPGTWGYDTSYTEDSFGSPYDIPGMYCDTLVVQSAMVLCVNSY